MNVVDRWKKNLELGGRSALDLHVCVLIRNVSIRNMKLKLDKT